MIGTVFDDYTVIEELGRKNNNRYYRLRCNVCGHFKECGISNLKKQDNHHSCKNCRGDYYATIVGQKFGDYYCKSVEFVSPEKGYIATIKCTLCGHETKVHASHIRNRSHNASTCSLDYHRALVGEQFGDLVIAGVRNEYRGSAIVYDCKCSKCGIQSIETMASLKRQIKHGAHCLANIPNDEYKQAIIRRFDLMDQRCNNPDNAQYERYGGRGIRLLYDHSVDLYCDFIDELREHAAIHGLHNSTFDRIDVNGHYEKSNLRIATQRIQSTNTTRRKLFIIENGDKRILSDSAMECGRFLGINGRSVGNVIRGQSKSSGGWRLYRIVLADENIDSVVDNEGVTTKLIVSQSNRLPVKLR